MDFHRALKKQLKRLQLGTDTPPADQETWTSFLECMSCILEDADQDRYLLERSLNLSSQEMQTLYQDLQQKSQRQLSQADQRIRSHTENSPLGIIEWNAQLEVIFYSQQAQLLFDDGTTGMITGKADFFKRIDPQDRQNFEHTMESLRSGALPRCVRRFRHSRGDGSSNTCEWYFSALRDETGELLSILSHVQDITQQAAYESAIIEACKRAEKATEAKSQFLATMSHELRTPLNGIIGFCDLLLESDIQGEQESNAQAIKTSGHHLLQVVNDVLDFSKIESGKLELDEQPINLEELLAQIDTLYRLQFESKGLQLVTERHGSLPEAFLWDGVRLKQCLFNLINNALKFTVRGGVTLHVGFVSKSGQLSFGVEDTGIGIPPEKQASIFEAFSQADGTITRRYGGSGLGLAITLRLVELMGGQIKLQSEVGRGSRFDMIFENVRTVCETRLQVPEKIGATPPVHSKKSFQGKILVAEDNLLNQKLVSRILKGMGLTIDLANDGVEAVDLGISRRYDLIFMDMHMPNLSGFEATTRLKKAQINTPIVALTASALPTDRDACMAAGCDEFLTKPIDRRAIAEVLEQYLSTNPDEQKADSRTSIQECD